MKRNFSFKVIKNLIKHTILVDAPKSLLNKIMGRIEFYNNLQTNVKVDGMFFRIEDNFQMTIYWNDSTNEMDFKMDYNPDGMINYTLKFSLNLDDSYCGESEFIPIDYEENNLVGINFDYQFTSDGSWTLDDGFPTAEDLAEYGDIVSHEEREIIERAMEKNDM